MQLIIRDSFPGDRDLFWKANADPHLDAAMAEAGRAKRELISETHEGQVTVRVQRFHANVELPAPVRRAMGTDTLTYDQTTRTNEPADCITWHVVPAVMADRVVAKGLVRLEPTPSGIDRIIEGEVTVRIPIFGKTVEKLICDMIEQGYHAAAEIQRQWMADHLANKVV